MPRSARLKKKLSRAPTVKRERSNGRYYVVQRRGGRVVSRKRWKPSAGVTVSEAKRVLEGRSEELSYSDFVPDLLREYKLVVEPKEDNGASVNAGSARLVTSDNITFDQAMDRIRKHLPMRDKAIFDNLRASSKMRFGETEQAYRVTENVGITTGDVELIEWDFPLVGKTAATGRKEL